MIWVRFNAGFVGPAFLIENNSFMKITIIVLALFMFSCSEEMILPEIQETSIQTDCPGLAEVNYDISKLQEKAILIEMGVLKGSLASVNQQINLLKYQADQIKKSCE